jgi:hypothetical protein
MEAPTPLERMPTSWSITGAKAFETGIANEITVSGATGLNRGPLKDRVKAPPP